MGIQTVVKTYKGVVKSRTKTCGAIIRKDDKYAMVQGRHTYKWSFPKGHVNEGEKPIECTLREVAEETGIDNLPEPLECIRVGYGTYFMFRVSTCIPLIPRDTYEIMNTKWASLEDMNMMNLNSDARQFVEHLKRLYG